MEYAMIRIWISLLTAFKTDAACLFGECLFIKDSIWWLLKTNYRWPSRRSTFSL